MAAANDGINSGVIASIFSFSTIFTVALFYILYSQKINAPQWISIILIVAGVFFIN
jgi:drug/metabolite transporter (DMT)-like permease